jgi:hypothetical protein
LSKLYRIRGKNYLDNIVPPLSSVVLSLSLFLPPLSLFPPPLSLLFSASPTDGGLDFLVVLLLPEPLDVLGSQVVSEGAPESISFCLGIADVDSLVSG